MAPSAKSEPKVIKRKGKRRFRNKLRPNADGEEDRVPRQSRRKRTEEDDVGRAGDEEGEEEEKMAEDDPQIEDAAPGKRRRKQQRGEVTPSDFFQLFKMLDEEYVFLESMKKEQHIALHGTLEDRFNGIKKLMAEMAHIGDRYQAHEANGDDLNVMGHYVVDEMMKLPSYENLEAGVLRLTKQRKKDKPSKADVTRQTKQRKQAERIHKQAEQFQKTWEKFETITPEMVIRANKEAASAREYEHPSMSNEDERSRTRELIDKYYEGQMAEAKNEQESNLDAMRAEEEEQRKRMETQKQEESVAMTEEYSVEELEHQAKEAKRLQRLLEIRERKFYDESENVTALAKQYATLKERIDRLNKKSEKTEREQERLQKLKGDQANIKKKMEYHKTERNAIHQEVTTFLQQLDDIMDDSEIKSVGHLTAIKTKKAELKKIATRLSELKKQITKHNESLASYDKDPDKLISKSSSKEYKKETEALQQLTTEAAELKERRTAVLETQRKYEIAKQIHDAYFVAKIDAAKAVARQNMQLEAEKPKSALSRYQDYEKQLDEIDRALDKLKADQSKSDYNEADLKSLTEQIEKLTHRSESLNLGLNEIVGELKKEFEFQAPETYMHVERYKSKAGETETLYNTALKAHDAKLDKIDKLRKEIEEIGIPIENMSPAQRKQYIPKYEELKKLEREATMSLEGVKALENVRKDEIQRDVVTTEKVITSSFVNLLDGGKDKPVRTGVKWEQMYSLVFELEGMIKSDAPRDSKWRKDLVSKRQKLHKLAMEGRHSPENPDPLKKAEVMRQRQKALKAAKDKYVKNSLADNEEFGDYAFSTEFEDRFKTMKEETEKEYKEQDQQIQNELYKKLHDRVYAGESIQDYTDAVVRVRQRMIDLFKEMENDVSANGPLIMQQAKMIYDRFQAMIKGATPQLIKEFNDALNDEKNLFLQESAKGIREVSEKLYQKEGKEFYASSKNPLLVDYLMDPLSFADGNKRTMLMNTKLGMAWTESHRLVGLLQRQFDLRQKMVPLWEHINVVDEGADGGKFDLVFTHLFPPSVVDMKLRMLKLMSAEQRAKIEGGPFMQALKSIDPEFDIDGLSGENFIDVVVKLQSGAEKYVKGVAESGGFAIADIITQAEEIERSKALILAQVDPKMDPALQLDPEANRRPPEGQMPLDPDTGAAPPDPETGAIINHTFNPIVQGQLTRDMIDDAKRQQFLLLEQRHMSLTLETVPQPPYVPLHVKPSQWFFGKEDYQSLQAQFTSMRPLIPKTRVEDPVLVIQKILALYGDVFGIKQRWTSDVDHPALIQQEAIELQQLEKAYKNYTTSTTGEYQKIETPVEGGAPVPSAPTAPAAANIDIRPDALSSGSSSMGKNRDADTAMSVTNPTSIGEELTDPFTKGLRAMAGINRIPPAVVPGMRFFAGRSGFGPNS